MNKPLPVVTKLTLYNYCDNATIEDCLKALFKVNAFEQEGVFALTRKSFPRMHIQVTRQPDNKATMRAKFTDKFTNVGTLNFDW